MLYIIGTHHMNILSVTDYTRIAQKTLLKSRYQRCDLITRQIFWTNEIKEQMWPSKWCLIFWISLQGLASFLIWKYLTYTVVENFVMIFVKP